METVTHDLQFRGYITGSSIKNKSSGEEICRYFGGVPYALPPVGPFRFLQPRPLPACYRYGTRANPGVFTRRCSVCPQARSSKFDDEDCLQLSIYMPSGTAPEEGWPVYFFIHGGFLQSGYADEVDPIALLSETSFKAIIVLPTYRLNVYGFLASDELLNDSANRSGTVGNIGFWDLRLALQWTYTNISYYHGNPSNITVAGYSAGAHAVFYQLAYDLDYPPEKRIIKRVCMHANGPGVQPKSLDEAQEQFDELLEVLQISKSLPAEEKLRLLRQTNPSVFKNAIKKMKLHQFRAVSDGHFVRSNLYQEIEDGTFAQKLLASDVQILIGESINEHFLYAGYKTPKKNADAVYHRFLADYPRWAVDVIKDTYLKDDKLPPGFKSWKGLFGHIYADMQIHVTERGFIDSLVRGGAGHLIHRYRIEWRSEIASGPKQFGATHAADEVLWFFGNGKPLPAEEKHIVTQAFINEYAKFVRGDKLDWGTNGHLEARRLRSDGAIDVWADKWWEEKLKMWRRLQQASSEQSTNKPTANL